MTFKPQKVLHLQDELDKAKPKLHGEFILTEKVEGWYVYVEYGYNAIHNRWIWGNPKSSAGREIPSLRWMKDRMNFLGEQGKTPMILIAEAFIPDMPFSQLNGILNRSTGEFTASDAVLICHDLVYPMGINTIGGKIKDVPAFVRMQDLNTALTCSWEKTGFLKPVPVLTPSPVPYSEKVFTRLFEQVASQGGEGIVAKRADSLYQQGKRNSDLLKLKLECTVECVAVRLEESVGEKGNEALTLVSTRANGIEVRTVIANHAVRDGFRKDPSSVIGKTVTVKAMQEFPDGQLRQPVFGHVRHDLN